MDAGPDRADRYVERGRDVVIRKVSPHHEQQCIAVGFCESTERSGDGDFVDARLCVDAERIETVFCVCSPCRAFAPSMPANQIRGDAVQPWPRVATLGEK